MPSIRKITVNGQTYDILPKSEREDAATLFLRGDGTWTTTPGQEIFVSVNEPIDESAMLWLRA